MSQPEKHPSTMLKVLCFQRKRFSLRSTHYLATEFAQWRDAKRLYSSVAASIFRMIHSIPPDNDPELQSSIEQSLQALALELGESIDPPAATQLYQTASDLLSHISYAPLTLARVAGTLLVYQVQQIEAEEVEWFKAQVEQCPSDEEVEELIESLHRADAL